MVSTSRVAAVGLGGSSGRVMVGTVGAGRLEWEEVHRFAYGPVRLGNRRGSSTLHWDILGIYILVQAHTLGVDLPDLEAMRVLVAATHSVRRYEPSGRSTAWDDAEARLAAVATQG